MEVVGKQHSNSRKAASHNHSHENIRAAPPLMKWVTFIVKAGESLPIGDANGLSDPYVTIDLGKKRIVKTSVKFKTLDPEWNEEYHVQVDLNDPAQEFVVCVKDKDFIGIDKLCYMTLPLKKLRQEGSVEGWHYLTKKAHLIAEIGYGKLHMDVLVEGFEAPTDAESADTVEAHAARDRISVGSGNAGVGGNSTRSGSSLTTSSSNQEKHFLYHSENRLPDHDEENVTRY